MADPPRRQGPRAQVKVHTDGARPVVRIVGEIDMASVATVRPVVDELIAQKPERLRFDLSGVTFMDSSGLSLLVAAVQRVPRVELLRPPPLVSRLVELTGLREKLPVVE
jgi:anti-sigma B factor antagonist